MPNSTRFQSAISTIRPRGARIIEAYSPKLNRRLQCFGEEAFSQWICLEADPTIQTFCERPTYLNLDGEKRLADFWIRQQNGEALLVIAEKSLPTAIMIEAEEIPLRTITSTDLAAARIWISNWERMLPIITSSRDSISRAFSDSVLKFVSEPMQLSRIEREFATSDPSLIRATIFTLLHRGQLQASQLKTAPLTLLTCFQPAEGQQ